jgi:L,D-transpeptidase catalytic domain/Bacterial Ig-like domain
MSRVTLVAPIGAAEAMAGAAFAGGRHRRRNPWVKEIKIGMLVALACGVLAAGTTFAVKASTPPHQAAAMASGAHAAQAASRGAGSAASLRVLSISPGNSADPVTAVNPVRVVFSAPLAPKSPLPTFSPAVAGRWHAAGGSTIVFTPAAPFEPSTEVTLQIPAGSSGLRSATGALLTAPVTTVFQAGGRSTLRMEQLLAQLGYLPMTWTPRAGAGGAVAASYTQRRAADDAPAGGMLTWQSGYPSALTGQWQPGQTGVILSGALMAFQLNQGLPMTGTAFRGVWRALLNAAAEDEYNGNGYSFALVSKTLPETITVWHDGRVVVHGLANTGAADTPTPDGTFPVYLRRQHQVMRGLMPDGTPYADPVKFVSFFQGDYAVHSIDRASYGSPQSLGCVELPLSEARQVWPYLTYGTLVTVTG